MGHGEAGLISGDWVGDRRQNYHIVKLLGGNCFFCECPNLPYLSYFNGSGRRYDLGRRTSSNQGGDMKFATFLLTAALLFAGVRASYAVVRIADDRGGRIGTYLDKYHSLRTSGETVIIDGYCASACTIILGIVPNDKICVTSAR
jgi:hypothetical protein